LVLLFLPICLFADSATFDLDGPALHVKVIRGKQTLGIGEIPNLLSGDKLWIQPAFPKDQTVRYLLIVSFLRGATGECRGFADQRHLDVFCQNAAKFDRSMKLEIATSDESASIQLGFPDGGLVLQDAETARVKINPSKSFGPSVFGELRFCAVDAKGSKGDWQPLTRLLRLPKITRIVCPENVEKLCRLEGSDLFLIHALSADEKFTAPVVVPAGFAETSISVPRPIGAVFYLKLRDAPEIVNRLLVPVFPEPEESAGSFQTKRAGSFP